MRNVGHWAIGKTDNDCLAIVKAVNWRKPKSFQFLQCQATSLSREREQCSTTSSLISVLTMPRREPSMKACVSHQKPWRGADLRVCESTENLLHIFGPENFTCDADVCSHVPNSDNSVVSDCGDSQLRTGDTCTARCAAGYVLGVRDTEQTFSCQPDGVVSGTQPVCELLPCSAPMIERF